MRTAAKVSTAATFWQRATVWAPALGVEVVFELGVVGLELEGEAEAGFLE
jgi:hypothetical protein